MLIHANLCLQADFLFVNFIAVCLDEIKMKNIGIIMYLYQTHQYLNAAIGASLIIAIVRELLAPITAFII